MAFKTAAAQGFKEAMAAAGVAVLEPISLLRVTVPVAYEGDVMGDITSRRGRIQGTDSADHGEHVISAFVPTSELVRYAVDLRSMTGGRGQFTASTTTTTCCRRISSIAPRPPSPGDRHAE